MVGSCLKYKSLRVSHSLTLKRFLVLAPVSCKGSCVAKLWHWMASRATQVGRTLFSVPQYIYFDDSRR